MKTNELSLKGVLLISPQAFLDERGFFKETYHKMRYGDCGIAIQFVQDNHSFSKKNVIRGMHFQSTPGQDKLVSVTQGKIFDVVVDLRKDSPTFGRWEGIYLDGESHQQLFIPKGFAHGFCVVSNEGAHVTYKVSTPYDSATEKTFRYNDPTLAIQWPTDHPIVSPRDLEAPLFLEALK